MVFRARIDCFITASKSRVGAGVEIIGGDGFSIKVVVLIVCFFFLFLRDRKALEF
jgi:hypothetical protein